MLNIELPFLLWFSHTVYVNVDFLIFLIFLSTISQTQMPDPKTFKQHFESKHPKSPMPPELVDVEA